jgi:hypothetical protein
MAETQLEQLRQIALDLPGVSERISHHAPTFYVGKKPICRFHDADYAGDGRISMWCPAPPGVREEVVTADPERFFAPTPSASGVFGNWIGVYLDTEGELAVDWHEITAIVEEAYRVQASRKLVAELDNRIS